MYWQCIVTYCVHLQGANLSIALWIQVLSGAQLGMLNYAVALRLGQAIHEHTRTC